MVFLFYKYDSHYNKMKIFLLELFFEANLIEEGYLFLSFNLSFKENRSVRELIDFIKTEK